MRIDPKYFNTFLLIVAVVAASLIAFFVMSNRSAERSDFKQRMFAQDSLQTIWWNKVQSDDSLRIADFKGAFIVLDLWSNWSDASLNSHTELAKVKQEYPNELQVMAAAVGLQKQEVEEYIEEHKFPFHFVAGSRQFSAFDMPGLPVQFVYDQKLELRHVFLGYSNDRQYDSLRVLITNGNQQ
ncbi:TlpA family protein disulfide reductase [Fodinibius sp. SL11]|uniref:TlpA family protein disulfide reductase n=1 Tax=Fodinibius sp. SL11 TaxID=3425690 RepID=UPI003F884022